MAKYIYVLTNPYFPGLVKIGYSKDVDRRIRELNAGVPNPYVKFLTYKVNTNVADKEIHKIIDTINPELRVAENNEFFSMTSANVLKVFTAMAKIHGTSDNLTKEDISIEDQTISDDAKRKRKGNFSFFDCGIREGEVITFAPIPEITCTVVGNKKVCFNGDYYSLSKLAQILLRKNQANIQGPAYFKYNNEYLNDMRDRLGV